ncbi:VOC family protein [Aureitalea marina]|uniref:Glyoxalase n=1 Tax=Aureitalea marina TaxID=930804 RepID=A0A2S7KPF4_9FLAO|nr:VOC family protein [Aureitalea marina]PQB04514.1 glyoxalase [Aureitalea marina]
MLDFKLNFLDHVAIHVKDIETSIRWYEKTLGLKRYELPEWKPYPIFLLAGKTGIALFPADLDDTEVTFHSRNVKIDHYAFQVSREDLDRAILHYEQLGLEYNFQDHHYFHSVYTKDPDGHTVELTAIVVAEDQFYQKEP